MKCRNEARQWNGSLEKFQYERVDSLITADLTTAKDEAKAKRKALNRSIEDLRGKMESLMQDLNKAINSAQA